MPWQRENARSGIELKVQFENKAVQLVITITSDGTRFEEVCFREKVAGSITEKYCRLCNRLGWSDRILTWCDGWSSRDVDCPVYDPDQQQKRREHSQSRPRAQQKVGRRAISPLPALFQLTGHASSYTAFAALSQLHVGG